MATRSDPEFCPWWQHGHGSTLQQIPDPWTGFGSAPAPAELTPVPLQPPAGVLAIKYR